MKSMATKHIDNTDLRPGMILVGPDGQRLEITGEVEASSAMPGCLRVETDFGTLYVDEDGQSQVEAPSACCALTAAQARRSIDQRR
jgi:hypothetical protein